MHDLVYVKYNQKLFDRYNIRDEIDPISLNDIDECNEWMVGEMDDENDVREDLVFDDPNLTWQVVYEASGIGEPTTNTRQQTRQTKAKQPANTYTRKRQRLAPTSASKGKAVATQEEDDEDDEDWLQPPPPPPPQPQPQPQPPLQDELFNFEESEEEGEGGAPHDNNLENDYVGVDEED